MMRPQIVSTLFSALVLGAGLAAPRACAEPVVIDEAIIQSQDPGAQVSYASVLFYQAKWLMGSQSEQSRAVFHRIEHLLLEALRLTETQDENPVRRVIRSQAAFLLGDVCVFVFNDRERAEAQYRLALEAFPGHVGASQALARIEMSAPVPAP